MARRHRPGPLVIGNMHGDETRINKKVLEQLKEWYAPAPQERMIDAPSTSTFLNDLTVVAPMEPSTNITLQIVRPDAVVSLSFPEEVDI